MKFFKIIGNIIIFIGLLLITTVVILGVFAEPQFRVKFDADNGSSITTVFVDENTAVSKPTDPVKTGHTFKHWANGTTVYDFATLVNENIDLKATYTADTYTLNFDTNGGSVLTNETLTVTFGETYTFETPTKEGFGFVGWFDENENEYKSGEWTTALTNELNLVAKWGAVYDVTYNLIDGGTHTNPTTFTQGTTVELKDATKDGYTFNAWYVDASFSTSITELNDTTVTGNITLYAKFTENTAAVYTITYVVPEGATKGSNPDTFTQGTNISLIFVEKEGFTFKGWYTDAEFTNAIFELNDSTVTSDITLYVKFEENVVVPSTFEITYDLNDGTNGDNPDTFTQGDNEVTLIGATKEGYTFVGWYTDRSFTTSITVLNDSTVTSDITLYAKFEVIPTTFDLTYELYDGTNGDNPITFTQGDSEVTLIDATKEGYTFNGWYTDSSFTTSITVLNDSTVTSDITLYASFTEDII